MYLIEITYTEPAERHLPESQYYAEHIAEIFSAYGTVLSARKTDGSGWLLIADFSSNEDIKAIIAKDPLAAKGAAEYRIVEFDPTDCNDDLQEFAERQIMDDFMLNGSNEAGDEDKRSTNWKSYFTEN